MHLRNGPRGPPARPGRGKKHTNEFLLRACRPAECHSVRLRPAISLVPGVRPRYNRSAAAVTDTPPARIVHVPLQVTMNECIFCRIIAGEIPSRRVHEDADTVAFEDVNPAAPVHILIVPKSHIASLDDTSDADERVLGRLVAVARNLARTRGLTEGGYRLVMNVGSGAGQSVFHIHLHLLGGRGFQWPPG